MQNHLSLASNITRKYNNSKKVTCSSTLTTLIICSNRNWKRNHEEPFDSQVPKTCNSYLCNRPSSKKRLTKVGTRARSEPSWINQSNSTFRLTLATRGGVLLNLSTPKGTICYMAISEVELDASKFY